MNLHVALIMPDGADRQALAQHLEGQGCGVQLADDVDRFLARPEKEYCSLGILDFGPKGRGSSHDGFEPYGEGKEAIRRLKECWPRMQLALLLERSETVDAAETLEIGIRNIFLKPVRFDALDGVLKAAEKSAAQQARQQRETARIEEEFRFERIVGESPAIRAAIELAQSVSESSATSVLVLGESGVGKELFARAIHGESPRAKGPFMEINCAAIPRELLESELFGHEKGAFTDATQTRVGLFEAAHQGSVFLDEVGELPLTLQAKLLKFLDSKIVRRVGGSRDIPVDVRILAATNRNLALEVRQARFREDLYYRLNVVPIEVPPLRERGSDCVLLARRFVDRVARKLGKTARISPKAEREIQRYSWPGNVRELTNVIERAVLLAKTEEIGPGELAIPRLREGGPSDIELGELGIRIPADGVSLLAVERAVIEEALARTQGNVVEAARLLRVGRGSLRCKMRRHRIESRDTVPVPAT